MKFVPSGLIKDLNDLREIEFWGHDAGEFVEELEGVLDEPELDQAGQPTQYKPEAEDGVK